MKKQLLFWAMCIAAILSANAQTSVWDGTHTTWTKGTGTQANPYLIENAGQLAHLAYIVNNGVGAGGGRIVGANTYWKLMTNIDLKGSQTFQWTPIGYYTSASDYYAFGGNFDGNGKTISNLFINTTTLQRIGLFGYTDGASIKNLGIVGSSSVTSGNSGAGIIGNADNTIVDNCYNVGNISAKYQSGGIIGTSNNNTTINNCYNMGNISAVSYYSGGIVGYIGASGCTINNCYNIGYIAGGVKGGIVGYYVTGGGNIKIDNSYYLVTCGAAGAGQSKTEVYMKDAEFVSLLNSGVNANFAYKQDITPFVNNGYPVISNGGFEIQTLPATNINRDNATLKGTIKQGTVTLSSRGFQYKKTTETDYTSVIVASSTENLEYNLTGLQPNTNYQYRTFATNTSNDHAFGDVMTFTTTSFNTNSNGEFLIENKEDLVLLANLVNGGNSFSGQTFTLANDITLPITPNNILSIGTMSTSRPFSGTFNGNGNRIYNVYIDQPNTPYQGFFGYTKNAYLIKVGLVNITASGRNYTGGMVGYADNTKIDDSYITGGTLFALSYCGGLIGYQTPGTNSIITGCYNTGCAVTGNNYVGGLLGYSNKGTVRNSYVAASVTGNGTAVGAIVGGAQDMLFYYWYFNEETTCQAFAIGENNISKSPSASASQRSSTAAGNEGNMSSADMRLQAFVNTLNQGLVKPMWKMDYATPVNKGFPILMWQTAKQTGIEEITTKSNITFYPNPAKDYLLIQSDSPVEKIEIYNQTGVCVLINNRPTEKLNVSNLPAGFYLVRIYVDRIPVTRKMIIKK